MELIQSIKSEILLEIGQLPNPHLTELQNFIRYLKFKQTKTAAFHHKSGLIPENDPILKGTGIADTEAFSGNIDEIHKADDFWTALMNFRQDTAKKDIQISDSDFEMLRDTSAGREMSCL